MSLTVTIKSASKSKLRDFRELLDDFPGRHEVIVQVEPVEEFEPTRTGIKVDPDARLIRLINQTFGYDEVKVTTTKKGIVGSV